MCDPGAFSEENPTTSEDIQTWICLPEAPQKKRSSVLQGQKWPKHPKNDPRNIPKTTPKPPKKRPFLQPERDPRRFAWRSLADSERSPSSRWAGSCLTRKTEQRQSGVCFVFFGAGCVCLLFYLLFGVCLWCLLLAFYGLWGMFWCFLRWVGLRARCFGLFPLRCLTKAPCKEASPHPQSQERCWQLEQPIQHLKMGNIQ